MSSLPSPAGATELRRLIHRRNEIDRQLDEIARACAPRKALLAECNQIEDAAHKLIKSMDCESVGNYGWQGRMTWLFAEMLRQEEPVSMDYCI